MQTTEIVERVQQRAGLDSSQEAHDTVIAVLETLALRDLGEERGNFAAQLSKELGEVLAVGDPEIKERFDASDMVRRVAKHLGAPLDESQHRTHAAFSVLMEAVSDGQVESLLNALSNDYASYAAWED
ncbi:MAG: DUF2267 domain-containing protein [Yaniella sp.]|uniref:DUF2267 domain-containing protein n=1 Tax=Yaniella sp. TaxID=2773929 RepID=UPI003F9B889D